MIQKNNEPYQPGDIEGIVIDGEKFVPCKIDPKKEMELLKLCKRDIEDCIRKLEADFAAALADQPEQIEPETSGGDPNEILTFEGFTRAECEAISKAHADRSGGPLPAVRTGQGDYTSDYTPTPGSTDGDNIPSGAAVAWVIGMMIFASLAVIAAFVIGGA